MNEMKEQLKYEAKEDIKDALENGYSGYYCDLHNEVFNTDYYTTNEAMAKRILEDYGTFDAIKEVVDYELFNFGELCTDIADPCKVLNMLYYIIGEEVMFVIDDYWDEEADEETNRKIFEAMEKEEAV